MSFTKVSADHNAPASIEIWSPVQIGIVDASRGYNRSSQSTIRNNSFGIYDESAYETNTTNFADLGVSGLTTVRGTSRGYQTQYKPTWKTSHVRQVRQ
jgi:hypothetical protein